MPDIAIDRPTRRNALKTVAGVGSAALVTGAGSRVRAADTDPLTIVHGTQFHGRFGRGDEPNVSRYATTVNELREDHSNAVFVVTGDDIAKAPLATPLRGRHVIDALNYLDPAVAAIGNHEFDYGVSTLRERVDGSSFEWPSANLLDGGDGPVAGSERWTIESVGDVTVGFFGLTPRNTGELAPRFPEEYGIRPNVLAAREAVAELHEADADRIVCASHLALAGTRRPSPSASIAST